jgi:hypothetical protein
LGEFIDGKCEISAWVYYEMKELVDKGEIFSVIFRLFQALGQVDWDIERGFELDSDMP